MIWIKSIFRSKIANDIEYTVGTIMGTITLLFTNAKLCITVTQYKLDCILVSKVNSYSITNSYMSMCVTLTFYICTAKYINPYLYTISL